MLHDLKNLAVENLIGLTLGGGVALGVAGLVLFVRRGNSDVRNLGVGLITGAIFTVGVFGVQIRLEENRRQEQAQADLLSKREQAAAKDNALRLQIAMARDLTGFDGQGKDLRGIYLSGKKLQSSRLRSANLHGAELRGTDLRYSELQEADLSGAQLHSARLGGAILTGANLEGADLRGATLPNTALGKVKFKGTKVNSGTCWSENVLEMYTQNNPGLVTDPKDTPTRDGYTLIGHVCE